MMKRAAIVAAGILLAAVPARTESPIAVAIMTRTGLLLPFVQIKGNTVARLTTTTDDSNTKMTEEAARLQSAWTLRPIPDGATTEVTASNRLVVDLGYEHYEGWRTNFKGLPWPSSYVPIPKVGLATQGIIAELPEDLVKTTDADSQRVRALISGLAHSRESDFLKTDRGYLANKLSAQERSRKVVLLDKLWRRKVGDVATYYFEARKRYDHSALLLTGWIVVKGDRITPRFVTMSPSDDDYKQGILREVLGVIPLPGRDLWVIESHYYEGEVRSIREWPSGQCTLTPKREDCD